MSLLLAPRPRRLFRRPPDFVIGSPENPYLLRWWIIPRNRFFNIYLHKFLRDDDDRALHDHPWWSISYVLRGSYIEHLPRGRRRIRKQGRLVVRRATLAHRIELHRIGDFCLGCACSARQIAPVIPAWTLFITGPRIREWGFYCPKGWRHWKEFTSPDNSAEVGKGCD